MIRALPLIAPKDALGLVGQNLDGYRIDEPVGEGGFSYVYKATQLSNGARVAVKCLKLGAGAQFESSEQFIRRFRDEGRLLFRLSQGNADIVRCLVGGAATSPATGELVPYLVLEWLSGETLSANLRDRRAAGLRGRTLAETIELLEPAALALDHAHRHGVVHRDIKPANLLLARSDEGKPRVKVLDFGVAKIVDDTMGMTMAAATASNFMMCSPNYASPEQFDSKIGLAGPWTDVYSLALIVLETLRDARVRQSKGVVASMIEAIDPKTDLSASALGIQVPPEVERVLASAVSVDPRARPASAGALWHALTLAARGGSRPATDFDVTVMRPDGAMPQRLIPEPEPESRPPPRHDQTLPLGWAPPRPVGAQPGMMPPAAGQPPSGQAPMTPRSGPWDAPAPSPTWRPPPSLPQPSSHGPLPSSGKAPSSHLKLVLATLLVVVAAAALVAEAVAWTRAR